MGLRKEVEDYLRLLRIISSIFLPKSIAPAQRRVDVITMILEFIRFKLSSCEDLSSLAITTVMFANRFFDSSGSKNHERCDEVGRYYHIR